MDYLKIENPTIVLVASKPETRIIFPNNYQDFSQNKTIIAINDGKLPSEFPTSGLHYNFGSNALGCHADNI